MILGEVLSAVAMAWMDGQIAAVFNSPYIIPVAGCAMVACIVVSSMWAGVRSQEIKSNERLAKIAQGIPVEPDWQEATMRAAAAEAVPDMGTPGAAANESNSNVLTSMREALCGPVPTT